MFKRTRKLPGEKFYSQIPNHWIRDHRLTAMEFKVLCFWSSHEVDYRVTIQQTVAEIKEGRDAIYRAVAGLVRHGYVVRAQERGGGGASTRGGTTKFGAVDYELGPAAYEQQYERKWGRRDEPLPENQDAVGEDDVSAGRTASAFTGHGSAVTGKRDTKKTKVLENQGVENQPPPAEAGSAPEIPSPAGPTDGGGGSPPADETPHLVAARRVLAEVQATTGRPAVTGEPADRLAAELAGRLAAGWTEKAAVAALSGSMRGADNVYPVLHWRIGKHLAGDPPAAPTSAPRQRRPRCGTCGGGGKVRLAEPSTHVALGAAREFTRYDPCPDCARQDQEVAA